MTNCICHDVPLEDCPSIQDSPALSKMVGHSTFMHELNGGHGATVDTRMVPIIKFLNRLNVTTVSSRIDEFVTVTFVGADPVLMSELLFKHLKPMTEHHPGVHLELSFNTDVGDFVGIVELPVEFLDDFSTRVGIWLEMLHK